jgi:hypothetical protein
VEVTFMKNSVKRLVLSAVSMGKDRKFIRDSLFGNVSDVEVNRALRYFDRITREVDRVEGGTIRRVIRAGWAFLRIPCFFLVFIFLTLIVFFEKFFFSSNAVLSFREMLNQSSLSDYLRRTNIKSIKLFGRFRWLVLAVSLLLVFVLPLSLFATFSYSKECDNANCFREMVFECHRANFVSESFVRLDNQIIGMTSNGCKIRVTALANDINLTEGAEMTCYSPLGERSLPQTQMDLCTGKLREEIQGLIVSELYLVIGQNVDSLNKLIKSEEASKL